LLYSQFLHDRALMVRRHEAGSRLECGEIPEEKRTSGPKGRMTCWGCVHASLHQARKAKGLRVAQPFLTLSHSPLVHPFTGAHGFLRRRLHHRVHVPGCDAAGAVDPLLRHRPALPACGPLLALQRKYRLHG
jgi:hypothetical protein